MASNLRVDTILPSTGTNVAIGTDGGTVSLVGNNKLNTFEASCAGVWIHSEIGKKSGIGLISEDLIKQLQPILKKLYGRFIKQRTRKKS